MHSCLSTQVLGSCRGSLVRAMSYNHTSQLWGAQFGVRFGPLASVRQESTASSSLHTSVLNGDEGRTDSPVNPAQIGIHSADVVQDALQPVPRSRSASRPPISLPGLNVPASSKESVAAPVAAAVAVTTTATATAAATAAASDTKKIVEPPSTLLEFGISKKEFLAARAAIPGTPEAHWSYTMYHRIGKDGAVDNVKVHYCESKATTERVCKEYFLDEDVIGLDLEWMQYAKLTDGPRRNVSLIQIASPSRIALIHVAVFPSKEDDLLGPSLRKIMENPKVSKVGVNIGYDCKRLKTHLGVTVQGIFELSHLYKVVKHLPEQPTLINKRLVSLAVQVQDQLLLPLYKGPVVRTGNWMRRLSAPQINYAASDAYAGLQLYYVLEEKRKALVPCPPRPHHAELQLPIPLPPPPVVEKQADEDAAAVDPISTTSTEATASTSKPKAPKPNNSKSKADSPKASSSKFTASASKPSKPSKAKSRPPRPPKGEDMRDARIIAAEAELKVYSDAYTAANSTWPVTTPVRLRAYYIWYRNEDLCPADIAALLRDPPLLTSTVAAYIVDAIQREKFPYPARRLQKEVVCHIDLTKSYMSGYGPIITECSEAVTKMDRDEEEAKQLDMKQDEKK
ncbi:hypothetical protein V8C42DRAFT_312801 [Trichoderma barbatum]